MLARRLKMSLLGIYALLSALWLLYVPWIEQMSLEHPLSKVSAGAGWIWKIGRNPDGDLGFLDANFRSQRPDLAIIGLHELATAFVALALYAVIGLILVRKEGDEFRK